MQVSTPDAYKRDSPPHNYTNLKSIKNSSNLVHSNIQSSNLSFIHPTKMAVGNDSKWEKLNRITQGSNCNSSKARNHPLKHKSGLAGLTHDFGSSLSAQEKKRVNDRIKNHKLSCDSSLLKNNAKISKFNDSPSYNKRRQTGSLACKNNKYNENEMLKDYINSKRRQLINPLNQIEENLNNYFNSLEFPYNEVKSYLENIESHPHMNTRESHESGSKRVILNNQTVYREFEITTITLAMK